MTDFFGSVMGIKHTEAAYVGFTGRSKEFTSSQDDSSSDQIVDVVHVLHVEVSSEIEKVKCLTRGIHRVLTMKALVFVSPDDEGKCFTTDRHSICIRLLLVV